MTQLKTLGRWFVMVVPLLFVAWALSMVVGGLTYDSPEVGLLLLPLPFLVTGAISRASCASGQEIWGRGAGYLATAGAFALSAMEPYGKFPLTGLAGRLLAGAPTPEQRLEMTVITVVTLAMCMAASNLGFAKGAALFNTKR